MILFVYLFFLIYNKMAETYVYDKKKLNSKKYDGF